MYRQSRSSPRCPVRLPDAYSQYCHRRPKQSGHEQCGTKCKDKARVACLLCKSRPKYKRYHLCGKTCKSLATENTPLVLEAPEGHVTFDMGMRTLFCSKFACLLKSSGQAFQSFLEEWHSSSGQKGVQDHRKPGVPHPL